MKSPRKAVVRVLKAHTKENREKSKIARQLGFTRKSIKQKISEFSPSSIGFGGPATEFSLIVLFSVVERNHTLLSDFDILSNFLRRV